MKIKAVAIWFAIGQICDIISTYMALTIGMFETNSLFNRNWLVVIIIKLLVTGFGAVLFQILGDKGLIHWLKWLVVIEVWVPVILNIINIILWLKFVGIQPPNYPTISSSIL